VDIGRREFIAGAGAAGLAAAGFGGAAVNFTRLEPGRKMRHAAIGLGVMGNGDVNSMASHPMTEIAALCDVDAGALARVARRFPKARRYTDWRELLEKEKDLDSVNVSTPDHMHAEITLAAMRRGLHVYCQKPLCHDVAECRLVAEEAVKCKVVTQLGTQGAASGGQRLAVEYLRSGVIGAVKKVYMCSNRASAMPYRLEGPRPAQGVPPPKGLDWNLWLGNAPERPYAPGIYHPRKWRSWLDFGTGWGGDNGCHFFDMVWKGMNLGRAAPRTIRAKVQESWKSSPARRADVWPQASHIVWTFDGVPTSDGRPFTMEWFDGAFLPSEDGQAVAREAGFKAIPDEATVVFGTEGALLLPHGSVPFLLPKAKFAALKRQKMPPRNHYHGFLDACLGGEMCKSAFPDVGPMAEAVLLGTVAMRCPDEVLRWNAEKLCFADNASATAMLRRACRRY
jgi:predicted dehydrogenase